MNTNIPYNNQQIPPPPMPSPNNWRQRARNAVGKMPNVFPSWLSLYSIVVYILALFVVSFLYSSYAMPWYYYASGIISVVVFFSYGSYLANERLSLSRVRKERNFERKIFWIAFIPRVLWMFLIYYLFMEHYGDAFGFENGDAVMYDELGQFVANLIRKGNFHFYDEISVYTRHGDIADMGYSIYLGFIYWLTGSAGVETLNGIGGENGSIVAVRLLHCVWSSITVVLAYRLAKRNFGEQPARMAGLFCALWPNFWYYCGIHLKETEMVFLTVLFVEQADQMLRSRQFTSWKIVPVLIIGASLFTFRTVLGIVALLALIFTIVMSSTRVVTWGKRIIVGALAGLLIMVTIGNQIQEQATTLWEQANSDEQENNMEWRANRKDASGNTQSFAKYAGAAVFAPMIFTLPFPTMVRPFEGQELQQLLNGGYFTKNLLSFFTIFALVMLLVTGRWRDNLLPLSFVLGYLIVLIMSNFAHSDRFHQPAMPFEFMFAAYGLSVAVTKSKYKRWFLLWCILMFVIAIGWNWFKLAGRGLV